MFRWVDVPDDYLDFLRENGDQRIPIKNYGTNKLKPFFGVLFTTGKLAYITQISHPQPRHDNMHDSLDFIKIYKNDKLLCVVNLNYMFPVPIELITEIQFSQIDKYRTFDDDIQRSKYIFLLRQELQIINTKDLSDRAKRIYSNKYLYPNDFVSRRSLDFRALESLAAKYIKNK